MSLAPEDPAIFLPEYEALARGVGQAISEWASLEDVLTGLFAVLIGQPMDVASTILSPILSFKTRIDIINGVAAKLLKGKPEALFWKSLKDYMVELSGDRNNMAHSPLMGNEYGPCVGPSVTLAIAGTAKRTLSETEVNELVRDFNECRWLAYGFQHHLTGYYKRDEVYHKPVERRRPPRNERLASSPPRQKPRPKSEQ